MLAELVFDIHTEHPLPLEMQHHPWRGKNLNVTLNSGTAQIEVTAQPEGLHGGPEVWVRVLSNSVVDWPEVERSLTEAQKEVLKPTARRPIDYYPHLVTAEETAEHGMSYEDWWIFTAPFTPSAVGRGPWPRSAS